MKQAFIYNTKTFVTIIITTIILVPGYTSWSRANGDYDIVKTNTFETTIVHSSQKWVKN